MLLYYIWNSNTDKHQYHYRDSNAILCSTVEYFACQASGFNTDNTCSEELNELNSYSKTELNAVTQLLLTFSNPLVQFSVCNKVFIHQNTSTCRR